MRRLSFLLRWFAIFLLGWSSTVGSQPESEPQLEAAYLVNFLRYVEWPEATRTHATICLFGRDTLGSILARQEGLMIGGRELRTRRVSSPDELASCQILFIPDVEEARLGVVLRWTQAQAILTVSDMEGFARAGGGIELVRSNGRIQFIVNATALGRSGLKPSSPMMRLAVQVIGGER